MSKICPFEHAPCDRDGCNVEDDYCYNQDIDRVQKEFYAQGVLVGKMQMQAAIRHWLCAMHRFTGAEIYNTLANKMSEFSVGPEGEPTDGTR